MRRNMNIGGLSELEFVRARKGLGEFEYTQ